MTKDVHIYACSMDMVKKIDSSSNSNGKMFSYFNTFRTYEVFIVMDLPYHHQCWRS